VMCDAHLPITVGLAHADGIKLEGRFGDQVECKPPIVRDKLVELGNRQNERFGICRTERCEGNRRFVD